MDLSQAVLTDHARQQLARRQVAQADVRAVLVSPEQILPVRPGRIIAQAVQTVAGKAYLLRVVLDVDRSPPEVVTAYRTSRIERYRPHRSQP